MYSTMSKLLLYRNDSTGCFDMYSIHVNLYMGKETKSTTPICTILVFPYCLTPKHGQRSKNKDDNELEDRSVFLLLVWQVPTQHTKHQSIYQAKCNLHRTLADGPVDGSYKCITSSLFIPSQLNKK